MNEVKKILNKYFNKLETEEILIKLNEKQRTSYIGKKYFASFCKSLVISLAVMVCS